MRGGPRLAAGLMAAALVTLSLVMLSGVPWAAAPSENGELRLAWRFNSEPVRRCRRLSREELERLPVHMRRETECERSLRPYRLEVAVDALSRADEVVRARGARADRPLGVFRKIPVRAGRHRVVVRFSAVGGGSEEEPEQREPAQRERARHSVPGRLAGPFALDTTVTVSPRQVILVTFDDENGALVVKTRAAAGDDEDR